LSKVFEFDKAWNTQEPIPVDLGRLRLADGSIVRLFFTPRGLEIMVPKSSKCVHVAPLDESSFGVYGLGPPPGEGVTDDEITS